MCISPELIQLYLWKWNLWKCGKVQALPTYIEMFESFSFTFKNFIFVICMTDFLQVFKVLSKGQLISK